MVHGGALLDVATGMKAVGCVVDNESFGKPGEVQIEPLGNFHNVSEKPAGGALVVDDEALIRWSVSEALSDLGFDVAQAGDAASALHTVAGADEPFKVLVVDLRLPDMEDLGLLTTLRRLAPTATIVLMTAFSTPEVIVGAEALGATVIHKPFEIDELKRLVSR
jgi:DNA-binding NtrC family response regulator